jgi:hypothetical protein
MSVSDVRRRRLEAQGFVGFDDATLGEIGPWTRFSPSLCALLIGAGTVLASPIVLLAVMATALFGAVFPNHPFDLLYNYVVRRWTGTRPLPANPPQRRFACGIATVWLGLTAWAFINGALTLGYLLGGLMTVMATIVSTTDFCIPSLIYGLLFGRSAQCKTERTP